MRQIGQPPKVRAAKAAPSAKAEAATVKPASAAAKSASATASPQSKSHSLLGLAVFYGAAFIGAFNENTANVALVDVMREFGVASTTAQWLVTGYMIVTAIVVASTAFLIKRFTTRQLFFASSGFLVIGELLCLVAPSFPTLLAARLCQAFGSGIFIPLMMNAVLTLAPREKMGTFLSIGSAAITLGPAFAPVVSGFAVTLFGWRSIFVFPAAAGALLFIASLKFVGNLGTAEQVRLDVPSLLLAAAGLALFVFGIGELTTQPVLALACLVVSFACIGIFARRQSRIDNPLLDLRPLRKKRFSVACLMVVISMLMTFSMSVLLPLYFEGAFEFSALMAGLLILPAIVVNALTALIGGRIMDSRGAWPLFPFGYALVFLGQVFTVVFSLQSSFAGVVAASVVTYAGVGFVMSPVQTAGLGSLSQKAYSHGISIINTLIMVAASIGPALFVGIISGASATALAEGATEVGAIAYGFSQAIIVASVIAGAGLVVSAAYAWRVRRKIS